MKPLHFLVIEDSPADVRLIREALREMELPTHVTTINNGAEALRFVTQQTTSYAVPDMIMLDLHLPVVDGKEILIKIRENAQLKHTPVIVTTCSFQPEDIDETYAHNANCYITKPIDVTQLSKAIQLVVSTRACAVAQ